MQFDFTENVSAGVTVTYIDTEIIESARPEFEGLPLPNESEWRASANLDFYFPLSSGLSITGHVDATYVDEWLASLTSGATADSYELFNANAGVRGDNWGVSVFARNLTNEFIKFGTGASTSINDPRVLGIAVDYAF